MKTALALVLVLQLVAVAGPVCGNHSTTAESMDCCEKGHSQERNGIGDAHASDCCAACDIGKSQGSTQQKNTKTLAQQDALQSVVAEVAAVSCAEASTFDCLASPSPPDIFLLDRSLRI